MNSRNSRLRLHTTCVFVLVSIATVGWTSRFLLAQAADSATVALRASFEQQVKPFLKQNCVRCHNADTAMSGVRVDQLDAALEDRHLRLWEAIRKKIGDETMPPKGQPQPTSAERQQMVEWITRALDVARLRPTPKNGLVRRLTVSQYRNTLRELLLLDDDLTEALPPDAVSKDGFCEQQGDAATVALAAGGLLRDCRRGAQSIHRRSEVEARRSRTSVSTWERRSILNRSPNNSSSARTVCCWTTRTSW